MGPAAMASGATNILNPGTLTGGVLNGGAWSSGNYINTYVLLTHIRIVNKTTGSVNASLFIGGTGGSSAGTEFAFSSSPVPAQTSGTNWLDWYGRVRLDVGDYLTGLASASSSLTIEAEGEVGIA
jgi:hypothetical protein